jgi:hypothetical protein
MFAAFIHPRYNTLEYSAHYHTDKANDPTWNWFSFRQQLYNPV